ncbi:hypothetical protein ACHAW5_001935 [Stephanodiscus triporus]|uniref:RxLR effector protein n=1 Tax=Stephanodiscus triporus TaxID=2934178 RepID=A0ABD3MI41_9STRA
MLRILTFVTAAILSANTGEAFVSSGPSIQRASVASSRTALDAAPTMTAIDTIAYGLGATDKVKGTGVWNAFELNRESKEDEKDEKKKGEEDK